MRRKCHYGGDDGTTLYCDFSDLDNHYYEYLTKFNLAQAIVAMIGVLSIMLWYGKTRKPTFVLLISVCIVFATLFARAFSVM